MGDVPDITDMRTDQRVRGVRRAALVGLIMNLILSGAKLAGGILGFSHALVADGIHSLSDCFTDIAVVVGVGFWLRPKDESHPHGHARIETLVAGSVGVAIMLTGILIAWESFRAVVDPAFVHVGWIAFWIAVLSIISKEILYRWTIRESRRLKSAALAANAWHHRSDCLSSIPVAVVVLATRLNPSLAYLDGIAGGLVSILILRAGFRITKPAIKQLTDSSASREIRNELLQTALAVPGVLDVHDLRTRFQGDGIQADLHVAVDGDLTVNEGFRIATEVESSLYSKGPGVVDVLVRLEPVSPHGTSCARPFHNGFPPIY